MKRNFNKKAETTFMLSVPSADGEWSADSHGRVAVSKHPETNNKFLSFRCWVRRRAKNPWLQKHTGVLWYVAQGFRPGNKWCRKVMKFWTW